jgi:cysteinyl-tRNA synthetase
MSEETLGESFDIHGGGLDLIFPHHENEIAQSVSAHDGRPFARYWMHNGMLTVGGAKMAKSEGNFITVRDILAQAPGEVVRLALLGTHYRDPLDWTPDRLHQARHSLDRFYRALALPSGDGQASAVGGIAGALEDDLNTPLAMVELHQLASEINRTADPGRRASLQSALRKAGALLGLLEQPPTTWLHGDTADEAELIAQRIAARTLARKERRFADADRIRAELAAEAITLEDKPDGTTEWRRDWGH